VINGHRVIVVLPAYNAAKTLQATVAELPDTVDQTILVDDESSDETVSLARSLGLSVYVHEATTAMDETSRRAIERHSPAGRTLW